MIFLKVDQVTKQNEYGNVLSDITFDIKKFQKIVLAGETGSGKSTLLKIVAGLEQATSGHVWLESEIVKGAQEQLVAGHARIAYLSQHFELQKFLRVEQILQYANVLSAKAAQEIYTICQIEHLLNRKTDQLSGGEKQRIAIARLLIHKPTLLLLDEPYSNLDTHLKTILKSVIEKITLRLKITCMLVSHDPDDTLPWADKIIVLRQGNIVQQGDPQQIYLHPVNEYVAGLFGSYNVIVPQLYKSITKTKAVENKLVRPEQIVIRKSVSARKWKVDAIKYYGNRSEYIISNKMNKLTSLSTNKSIKVGDYVEVSLRLS